MPFRGERVSPSNGLGRISSNSNGRKRAKRPYRAPDEGIREWNPRPKPRGVVMISEHVSPSIRTAIGWLYPLEHYDEMLSLDALSQYAELLLLMGSNGAVDLESLQGVLRQARDRLNDSDYDRLLGYVDLLMVGRLGIPAELQ